MSERIERLSEAAYHQHEATGSTTVKQAVLHSVKHAKTPMADRDSFRFGRSFHLLLSDPDEWQKRTALKKDWRTKDGKAQKILNDNGEVDCFNQDELDAIEKMVGGIIGSKTLMETFNGGDCPREVSYFWQDFETGLQLKCRPDIEHNGIIGDWKSTTDASPAAARRTIINLGYHISAAMYLDGTSAKEFLVVFVEKAPPFGVGIYRISDDLLQLGHEQYRRGIQLLAQYKDTAYEDLPCYPDEIMDVLPYGGSL